jgi:hypothetical protein
MYQSLGDFTMSRTTIVTNEYITVEYLSDKATIYHTVHKPMGVEQAQLLRDCLDAGTNALKKYRISKWLSDDRKNGPLPPEVIQWGFSDWNPRTIKAGWKYWANVVPVEIAAAGTLMPVIQDLYHLGLRMQVFTKVEDALKWLDEMK